MFKSGLWLRLFIFLFSFFKIMNFEMEVPSDTSSKKEVFIEIERKAYKKKYYFIYIHGTINVKKAILPPECFFRLFDISNTYCKETLKKRTEDPGVFRYAILSKHLGLHKIEKKEEPLDNVDLLANILYNCQLKKEDIFDFLIFNWDGILSKKGRRQAAKNLYQEIKKHFNLSLENGEYPVYTICGYSHGGNVAANLSSFYAIEESLFIKKYLNIEKLIFIGTPIGNETEMNLKQGLFSTIYSFFSMADVVQRMDRVLGSIFTGSKNKLNPIHNVTIYNIEIDRIHFNNLKHHNLDHFCWDKRHMCNKKWFVFPAIMYVRAAIEMINRCNQLEMKEKITFFEMVVDVKFQEDREIINIKNIHKKGANKIIFSYNHDTEVLKNSIELIKNYAKKYHPESVDFIVKTYDHIRNT